MDDAIDRESLGSVGKTAVALSTLIATAEPCGYLYGSNDSSLIGIIALLK